MSVFIAHNLDASAESEPAWQVLQDGHELYDPFTLPFILPLLRCRVWALCHGRGWPRVRNLGEIVGARRSDV